MCQNGGICHESDTDSDNKLSCECEPGFLGEYCEIPSLKASKASASNAATVVVPIVVILLVLGAATGVWFFIRKRPL